MRFNEKYVLPGNFLLIDENNGHFLPNFSHLLRIKDKDDRPGLRIQCDGHPQHFARLLH